MLMLLAWLCSCEIAEQIINPPNPWHSEESSESIDADKSDESSNTESEKSSETIGDDDSEESSESTDTDKSDESSNTESEKSSETIGDDDSEESSELCAHNWAIVRCEDYLVCSLCGEKSSQYQGHIWLDATCEQALRCSTCGLTRGRALGHDWISATCETARYCGRCGKPDGEALGHKIGKIWTYSAEKITGSCTVCSDYTVTAPPCEHDLVCKRLEGSSYAYLCAKCPVGLDPRDIICLRFTDADDGYRMEISSRLDGVHINVQSLASAVREADSASVEVDSDTFAFEHHWNENLDSITELKIGEGIRIIDTLSILPIKTLTIGTGVEKIGEDAVFALDCLNDIYFEGDLPELEDNALWIYASPDNPKTPTIWKNEGAGGFDEYGMFIHGSTVRTLGYSPTLPSASLDEYAILSATESESLALEIIKKARESEYYFTALMPQCKITEYKQIKDFTLELTRSATTDYERAEIIFNWIVDNVSYDNDALAYPVHTVFETKKAVCAGYTGLMHDMLASVGIPSFYTRGISYFGTDCTTEQMISKEFELYSDNTHAWIILVTSENEVITCDPTWGDFDISAEEMAETHRATAMLEGITVLPDGFDHALYPSSVFYLENTLYSLNYGYITPYSGVGVTFNEFYKVTYQFHKQNDGMTTPSVDLPALNTAFFGDVIIYDSMKLGFDTTLFAGATFNTLSYREALHFVAFEALYYENELEIPLLDMTLTTQDGTLYVINEDNTLSVFGTCTQGGVNGMTVTKIYPRAFSHLTISSVSMPSTLEKIGYHAFLNCDEIVTVEIPSSVKQIEPGAFAWCNSLSSVTIYAGVEVIGFTETHTVCIPTNLFDDSFIGEGLVVYFVGTQAELDAISFYDPWSEQTDTAQREHFLSLVTVVSDS